MTTEPNATPTRSSLIGWIAANRDRSSHVLIGFGIVMIIATIFLALRWDRPPNEPPKEEKSKSKSMPELMEKEEQKGSDSIASKEKNPDYLWGAVWTAAIGVTFVGLGLWNINRQPQTQQESYMARVLVLATGGTAGILTALLGLKLGYHWEESLSRWINQGETKGAKWVLAALAILVAGLMITFVSLQQARTEIRNHPTIRRLVYGYNFGLTALLLLILLIAANMLASAKLPARLDTTAGGFYSLDPKSEVLLKDINQPIHAYFIASDNLIPAIVTDVRSLFANCAKINPKFKFTFLVPGINNEEIARLYDRLKIAEIDQRAGLILTAGEQEEHVSFVRLMDLVKFKTAKQSQKPNDAGGEQPQMEFEGEPKIMTELQFLAEGKVKPVIYFTQGAGEPILHPNPQTRGVAVATDLATALASRNFDVRTIVLADEKDNRWMKEATALVVFGPDRPLSEQEVKVIREYVNPAHGGKKGKLFALLPPRVDNILSRGKIAKTGLEPLLSEFGVNLLPEVIYIRPRELVAEGDQTIPFYHLELIGDPDFLASGNPMARIIQNRRMFLRFGVRPVQPGPVQGYRVEKLLVTTDQVPVWFETSYTRTNPLQTFKAMEADPALAREKRLGKQHVPVAVLVSEDQDPRTPRMAVFGMSDFIANHGLREAAADEMYNVDLFTGTLDWLRERPSNIGISPRVHNVFRLDKNFDESRLLGLPLGVMFLSIVGLGMGVWLMRRSQ